jgi:hypothetical protein
MPRPPAHNKARLLNPWALLLVTGALGGVLWFNFQDEQIFAPGDRAPDQISLNYAQLLLAMHPQDTMLRLRLLEQLLGMGDYATARVHLDQWPQPDPVIQAFYGARIDALALPLQADPAPVLARLDALDASRLSLEQLQALAAVQLNLQAPASAATTYATLARRDPPQRQRWWQSQARWAIAAGDPGQAGGVYAQLQANADTPAQQRRYLQQAFDQYLAAGQGGRGVALLIKHMPLLDSQVLALIEQGLDVALAQLLPAQAQTLLARARELQPGNPKWLAKGFELQLALNDTQGAWASGQALLAQQPDDLALRRRVAQVGEWAGARAQALALWMSVLQRAPDAATREHAWRLALAIQDYAHAIALLAPLSDQRPLTDRELDALLYAYASSPRPLDADTWLSTYVQRYPSHRQAWSGLLQVQQAHRSAAVQARTWSMIAQRFGLTPRERVEWADTYVRDGNPQAAWTALQTDTQGIQDPGYWRSRAALAWALDKQDHLREALEQLLASEGQLDPGNRSALVDFYRQRDPAKALRLAMDGWQQAPSNASLTLALQLALDQQAWPILQALLDDADRLQLTHRRAAMPAGAQAGCPSLAKAVSVPLQAGTERDGAAPAAPCVDRQPLQVMGRGALAVQAGDPAQAARLYREGLHEFADNDLLRERLLWLYLDENQLDELKPLISQWRSSARTAVPLWLPMASASLAVGDSRQALAWYRRYLREQPTDWLVQAAYADALDTAGYQDAALRLRQVLLRQHPAASLDRSATTTLQTWLRLLAASVSAAHAQRQAWQWQDGSPALLQLWFEQLLAGLDSSDRRGERSAWLEWARSHGLKISPGEALQQALRSEARQQLESLLARRDLTAAQRSDVLQRLGRPGEARQVNLAALDEAQGRSEQAGAELRNQAVQLEAAHPQGTRLSWNRQDYGGLQIAGPALQVAGALAGPWSADLKYSQGRFQSDDLLGSALGEEHNLLLALERTDATGRYTATLDSSLREDHNRTGLGLARRWQLTAGHQLQLGLDWHRQSDESGLMRTFGQRDQLYLAGDHAWSTRDQLSWRLSQKRFSTRAGESLGSGQAISVVVNHVIAAATPTWAVRSGVDYQRNALRNRALSGIGDTDGGALDLAHFSTLAPGIVMPEDLLQTRYGQLYVGSSWRRGSPGALTRTTAGYTWLLDTNLGWQWQDQTFNYGVTAGVGVKVLGGDELALKLGYQSAPQGSDGKAGGVLNLSYSVRLGR